MGKVRHVCYEGGDQPFLPEYMLVNFIMVLIPIAILLVVAFTYGCRATAPALADSALSSCCADRARQQAEQQGPNRGLDGVLQGFISTLVVVSSSQLRQA